MKTLGNLLALFVVASIALKANAVAPVTPAEARAIAKEAYIYGFPIVDNYRVQYSYFVDKGNPEFKAPWNQIKSTPRVYTPDDRAVQTPNSDTPYSQAGLDLRAEPIVLTVPAIEKTRYFSVQLIDAFTHNFAYLGSRATGNDGGNFLIAGPGWAGDTPSGIAAVIRSETAFVLAWYRTQLINPTDLENVKRVQAGYKVQTLSQFVGTAAPKAVPSIDFIKPLTADQQKTSLEFFNILNFALQFCPTHPTERELMARFAQLGIGAGRKFDSAKLPPDIRQAVLDGIEDAWKDFAVTAQRMSTGKLASGDLFGTREYLKNNHLYRMTAAVLGIYGNSKEEAIYPVYYVDAAGQKLDGSTKQYTLRFAPGQLPPVNAFWSLTMYEQPASLLTANPLNRYLINSPMLPELKRDADGGLTLHVQADSPGKDRESNWLPAPRSPFSMIMRLCWPKEEALNGTWKQPTVSVKVTPETYIRAETDRSFLNISEMAGGVNRPYHFRKPTLLDQQPVVRMNRDTLYTAYVVDTEGGAAITIPEIPEGRFMSVQLVDNDHYCPDVFYTSGTHKLPTDTKYLFVTVRIQLFNPNDSAEIALINNLQDQIVINAKHADPLPAFNWDHDSLKALTVQYENDFAQTGSSKGMMGPRGMVNETTRHLAAATMWGLNPDEAATYLNYRGDHDPKVGYNATFQVPENKAFWSITVYGKDGFMKSENCIVSSSNVKLNADGTFTVYFGSKELCGDEPNRLDVTEGWNFLMRVYRPGPSVLDGTYKLPKAVAVK